MDQHLALMITINLLFLFGKKSATQVESKTTVESQKKRTIAIGYIDVTELQDWNYKKHCLHIHEYADTTVCPATVAERQRVNSSYLFGKVSACRP